MTNPDVEICLSECIMGVTMAWLLEPAWPQPNRTEIRLGLKLLHLETQI